MGKSNWNLYWANFNWKNATVESVKTLLESGAKVNVQNKNKRTPLHCAIVDGGEQKCIRTLIDNGASVNVRDGDNMTPLHLVVQFGRDELLHDLVDGGSDINAISSDGMTSIHYAASRNDLECIRFLIDVGARVDILNNSGRTPLHFAVINTYDDFVAENTIKELISSGVDPNVKDNYDNVALHVASANSTSYIVQTLLDMGADPTIRDGNGRTSFWYATFNPKLKNTDVYQFLYKFSEMQTDEFLT